MGREARTFRQDAARHIGDRTGTAIRYTPDLRRRAVGIARNRRGAGVAAETRSSKVVRTTLQAASIEASSGSASLSGFLDTIIFNSLCRAPGTLIRDAGAAQAASRQVSPSDSMGS